MQSLKVTLNGPPVGRGKVPPWKEVSACIMAFMADYLSWFSDVVNNSSMAEAEGRRAKGEASERILLPTARVGGKRWYKIK